MKKFKVLILAVLVLLSITIVLQNTETVETKILFVSVQMPRALLLLLTLLVGFLLGLVSTFRIKERQKAEPQA